MNTESYESFATQVNFASEEEIALASAPEQPPITDEEIEDMARRESEYRAYMAAEMAI